MLRPDILYVGLGRDSKYLFHTTKTGERGKGKSRNRKRDVEFGATTRAFIKSLVMVTLVVSNYIRDFFIAIYKNMSCLG